jgi:hypothetical protein
MKTLITIFTIVAATIAAQALTLKLKLLDCPGGIQGHGTRGVADNSAIPGAFYHPTLTWTNKYPNQ